MKETTVEKVVIAHRGASGYLPEHTLAAKAMAYAMHPDYIEQDVVLSKDDIAIVIHDIYLEGTTDVATKFADRKRADGHFYVIDFDFEELKTLNAVERFDPTTGTPIFPDRFPLAASRFGIHSLEEEIELIQGLNKSTGQNIGIYPEIKNPSFHRSEGKDISKIVLAILERYGYTSKKDNCIVQCFDAQELQRIRKELRSDLFLVQLMETEEEIEQIDSFATYADGIGPWIGLLSNEKLMIEARTYEMPVHVYTLRKDQLGEAPSFDSLLKTVLFDYNVDGVFTDHPDIVVEFLKQKQ